MGKQGGIEKEPEKITQLSAEECSEGNMKSDEDCGVKSLPNFVSRSRVRSLATSVENDFKLKVNCQVEREVEIKDAEITFAPLSRRSRVQVTENIMVKMNVYVKICRMMKSNILLPGSDVCKKKK